MLLGNNAPLSAFDGNVSAPISEFYVNLNNYFAHLLLRQEISNRQTIARLGRTRFITRDFKSKVQSRPSFNKRLQKELNKEFRDLRMHKSRRSVGQRFRGKRVVKRRNLLAEGRRNFQETLQDRLEKRPQNRFRRRIRNRFQKQNNGPRVKRSDARGR